MASSARIDELRKKFEENPRRYFAPLANEYRKAGDINQAIAICREYLPQQPGHMSGHIVYGQALYEARQFDEAKTVFETALSLDPENLIALRHLGDIALIVGDSEGARTWYGRVLEADPRNEEIQAQLTMLSQASSTAPTPIASAAVPGPILSQTASEAPPAPTGLKPALASAPTVVMSAVPRPGQPTVKETEPAPVAPVTPDSPTAEIRLDTVPTHAPPPGQSDAPVEMALGLEPTSFAPPTEPVAPAPMLEIDSPVSGSREAPPLDSFSLAGLETTSLASEPAAPPEPSAAPAAPPPPPPPRTSAVLAELDLGAMTLPSAEPPPAPAPAAIPDLDFGEPVASAPPAATPAEELPLLDIGELPAAPVSEAAPPQAEAPVPEAVEAADIRDEAQVAPESGPFVTETMAELYLQQGHHEEALRVYRALLEQRPDDASLQAKVASLTPSAAPSTVVHADATIREILSVIAQRRPGFRPEPPRQNGLTPEAAQPSLGHDGLATLFETLQIAQVDETAAQSLAFAFMDLNGLEGGPGGPGMAPISGAPARHASNDLTLDTVFGAGEVPASAAPSNFSFDQFFSQRATAEHATGSGTPSTGNPESGDDVAKFTQWLEGLKQR